MILIVAPTDRGNDPSAELRAAIGQLKQRSLDQSDEVCIEVAVLSGDTVTIGAALDRARDRPVGKVILVSAQTVLDRSFDAWCRRVVGHWIRANNPDFPILLAPPLARQPGYLNALAEAVENAHEQITGKTAPLVSAAWEEVPGFARHVLLCRGPRCSVRGAADLARAVADGLEQRSLGDDDILMTQTGCLFPCNQGPVLVVYPDDVWYSRLAPDDVPRLIDEHLRGGRPLVDRLAPRAARSKELR